MTATAFLTLAAVALAVRAVESLRAIYAWAGVNRGVSALPPPRPVLGEQQIATIQLRRGRLVLVRRRA